MRPPNDCPNQMSRGARPDGSFSEEPRELNGGRSGLFAEESQRNAASEPGRIVSSSLALPWRSLLFQVRESPSEVSLHETVATPDQNFTAVFRGTSVIESASSGIWETVHLSKGKGGCSPPFHIDRLRWKQTSVEPLTTGHLYLPSVYLEEATEEFDFHRRELPNTFGALDPLIYNVMTSLSTAVQQGASELYAESAARFLSAHILLATSPKAREVLRESSLNDHRFTRVLSMIDESLGEEITVKALARIAGISPFHFMRAFKIRTGETPHAYITKQRMIRASSALADSSDPIGLVASKCGFSHLGHFAAAFRKHSGLNPAEYRQQSRAQKRGSSRKR